VEVRVESKTRGRDATRVSYPPVCRSREQSGKTRRTLGIGTKGTRGARTEQPATTRVGGAPRSARRDFNTPAGHKAINHPAKLFNPGNNSNATPTPRTWRALPDRVVNGDSLAPARKGRARPSAGGKITSLVETRGESVCDSRPRATPPAHIRSRQIADRPDSVSVFCARAGALMDV